MKRVVSLVLILSLAVTCLTAAVSAQTADEKISAELQRLIAEHPDGGIEDGVVVEIHFHNAEYLTGDASGIIQYTDARSAEDAMKAQIAEISYYETVNVWRGAGKVLVGLPYTSIEKVAQLSDVDEIALPDSSDKVRPANEKINDEALKNKMAKMKPEEKIGLAICFSYADQFVYVGIDINQCTTDEQLQNRIRVKRDKLSEIHSAKNAEYAARIAARAEAEGITAENISWWEYDNLGYLCTTVGEVERFTDMPEVYSLLFADVPIDTPSDKTQTLEERFEAWMKSKSISKYSEDESYYPGGAMVYRDYEELAAADTWALVQAHVLQWNPWEVVLSTIIGDRVLSWWSPGASVFPYGLFVYDIEKSAFLPIDEIKPEEYTGIIDRLNELKLGRALGDADGDNALTIIDATAIQRDLADLKKLSKDDVFDYQVKEGWKSYHYADFDLSGDLTILDATAIQRKLAEL